MTFLRALAALCIAAALAAAPAAAAPGDLDTGFATGGIFTGSFMTTFPGNEDSHKVAIDSQGRVVVAATLENALNGSPPRAVNVLRLTPQGAPDASFGTGGQLTLPLAGDNRLAGLVIDAQDRPIVAGVHDESSSAQIALVRLTPAGQPDPLFSGDGQVIAGLPGSPFLPPTANGLAIDAGGGLLVAGSAFTGGSATPFVTRFTSDGAPDTAYGAGGWRAITPTPTGEQIMGIHALPGGGAVVAGFNYDTWLVARLTSDGAMDGQFSTDGVNTSDLGKGALDIVSDYGMTVDADGRPIVVGQFTANGNGRWAIARMTNGGAMDPSFGTGTPTTGVVLGPSTGGRLNDVDVQADGKLVATGIASRADLSGNAMGIARYTVAGAIDTSFAPGAATPGIATVNAGTTDVGSDLALSPGAITAVGFRRADDGAPLGIRDLPIVVRLQAEAGSAPPVVVPATPAATPPAPAKPAGAVVLPKFTSLVTLPAAKQCVSRRKFSIRLRVPKGSAVTSAEVKVNGKRAAVRRGARLRSVVNLTQLPKGRFRVDIVLKLADGRTVKGSRKYRTCAVKRRSGSGPKV